MKDAIMFWNEVALETHRMDFALPDSPTSPKPERDGPTRTSWALAIVHLSMFDAYQGVLGQPTYLKHGPDTPGTTALTAAQTAAGSAARETLEALFPRQTSTLSQEWTRFLKEFGPSDPGKKGEKWGKRVAKRILDSRKDDGSKASDDYTQKELPYRHRVDPLTPKQGFLGPLWGAVRPFGISNLTGVIKPLPDPVKLPEYEDDYLHVQKFGRDQSTDRSQEQTVIGIFWAYDGARNIGTPPRLYNQAVSAIVKAKGGVTEAENAKLFAAVNVAMADAGIQAWHEKYKHELWRPVVGIREADSGWGPSGAGDSHAGTKGDPFWSPLGAPRTNRSGAPSFTPNFPAYPSGHATFGTAAFRVAQILLGLDDSFQFALESDEFNGTSVGATGVRPAHRRSLTIKQAIRENLESRVWLGVHWRFDCVQGGVIGEEIATKIAAKFPVMA